MALACGVCDLVAGALDFDSCSGEPACPCPRPWGWCLPSLNLLIVLKSSRNWFMAHVNSWRSGLGFARGLDQIDFHMVHGSGPDDQAQTLLMAT